MSDEVTHLVVPNPALLDSRGRPRVGCYDTVMLTACTKLLEPGSGRRVTLRVDLTTCPTCRKWADEHPEQLRQGSTL